MLGQTTVSLTNRKMYAPPFARIILGFRIKTNESPTSHKLENELSLFFFNDGWDKITELYIKSQ